MKFFSLISFFLYFSSITSLYWLLELYNVPGASGRTIIQKHDSLEMKRGLKNPAKKKLEGRRNLGGANLRVASLPWGVYLQNDMLKWSGIVPDILDEMSRMLNFTYLKALARDGNWGTVNPETGEWNGLIRDLLDNAVDIVAAPLIQSKSRSEVIDFLLAFNKEKDKFFVPRTRSYSWTTFLLPFVLNSWAVILVMVILVSCSLTLVTRWGRDNHVEEFKALKCVIFVCGSYLGLAVRRWSVTPFNISARFVIYYTVGWGPS